MKKKVLFIIWSFTAGGGAEKILANVVNNLDEDIYDISVLEFIHFDVKREYTKECVKFLKPALSIPDYSGRFLKDIFKKITWSIKCRIYDCFIKYFPGVFRKILIKENYDIEVAFNYQIPSYLVAASGQSTKKYGWVHGAIDELNYKDYSNVLKKIKNYNLYRIQHKAFSKLNNIVLISNRTYKSVEKIFLQHKSKFVKIYNGYDFGEILKKSEESINISKSEPMIIAVGRLDPNKNFQLLIKAASILKQQKVRFKIYILGDGELKNELANLIVKYDLTDYVTLTGYVNNPYPYMKMADLYCLTSILEGFPTVIVESMALGCPFISTNVAGVEELSNNGACGLIVESDAYSFASTIKSLIENNKLRAELSSNCEIRVKEFTLQRQIENIEKMFEKR